MTDMSNVAQPLSTVQALARAAGGEHVIRRADLPYSDQRFDVYEPLESRNAATVVIVLAMPDSVLLPRLGCAMKDTPHMQAWGRWLAAEGIRVVTASTEHPATDMPALWAHLCANALALDIDLQRIGVIGWSGHGPLALSLLRNRADAVALPRCAALLYAYSLDRAGASAVANTVRSYGMALPELFSTLADLRADALLFIARAGRDAFPHLNSALQALTADALAANRSLTLMNLPTAEHAFDLQPPTPEVSRCMRALLDFLRNALA